MINLMEYNCDALIENISNRHLKALVKWIFETKKSFIMFETNKHKWIIFEIMSFDKRKNDLSIKLQCHNKIPAIYAEDAWGSVNLFYENKIIPTSYVKLLDSFDEGMEYML